MPRTLNVRGDILATYNYPWFMYEPDIELPVEHWNDYVEVFMMSVNDNDPQHFPPVAA